MTSSDHPPTALSQGDSKEQWVLFKRALFLGFFRKKIFLNSHTEWATTSNDEVVTLRRATGNKLFLLL
jgi:hypothetical protein